MLDHVFCMQLAAQYAAKSRCSRAQCGAVIVADDRIISYGFNSPPKNNPRHATCDRTVPSSKKPKSDRIIEARVSGYPLSDAILFFVRIDENGQIKRSGRPYCTVCSRLALDNDIGYWALYHEDGIRIYNSVDYNRESILYDSLT
jgi:deoxycytidylate deaminase